MLAQYWSDTKEINIFPDRNSKPILVFNTSKRESFGFPPFSDWTKTSWGFELEFRFEVASCKSEHLEASFTTES